MRTTEKYFTGWIYCNCQSGPGLRPPGGWQRWSLSVRFFDTATTVRHGFADGLELDGNGACEAKRGDTGLADILADFAESTNK
jgi:hypothetical protein